MRICILLLIGFLFSCQRQEARRPVSAVSSALFMKSSAVKNQQLLAREQHLIDSIIAKDSIHRYETSKAGFRFYYLKKNPTRERLPEFGDKVTFSYEVSDLDGNVIYTEQENGIRQYRVDKEKVFLGLQRAVKLLQEGEEAVFYFPSAVAFGYFGDRDKIGVNQPIVVRLQVLSIEKVN